MSDRAFFLAYCIDAYRAAKKLSGTEVIELFNKYGVKDYLLEHYEVLHSFGIRYIICDIDEFIEARQESVQ